VISVIIPTLNEADRLAPLLRTLGAEPIPHEVIVADGGSGDGTLAAARALGARVVACARGRGGQLRAGAAAARGQVLLFLHADSRFPAGGLAPIEAALAAAPALVGGNFRLVFDGASRFSRRLTAFYAWLRGRGLYYGDSGIFVRREAYERLGGVRAMALMEDYDFVRRLERLGPTCCIPEPPLTTSSRRFEGRHGLAIVWGWLLIHALYHLGVSPRRLAGIYRSERH
jgi:rSAM/selenodomain-associated transferase 2